jgi:hypothetical protein
MARKALWNAVTRYGLLKALDSIGKLNQCTDLTNDGLDKMLEKFTDQIKELRTRKWAEKVGPGGPNYMRARGISHHIISYLWPMYI